MRIIIQPVTDGFELCARLGLVFAPLKDLSGKAIYAVLRGSPSAKAGLIPIVTMSDRRSPSRVGRWT